MKLITFPHPSLRRTSKPISVVGPEHVEMAMEMLSIVHEHSAYGLSSNQIDYPYSIIVVDYGNFNNLFLFNAEVVKPLGLEWVADREACLSLPGKEVVVPRWDSVYVIGLNEHNETVNILTKGFEARIFQHEIDHLNGKLIIDYE